LSGRASLIARLDELPGCLLRLVEGLPPSLCKMLLVVEHPQIEIRFRPAWEFSENVTLPYHVDNGHVYLVVPVHNGFLVRDIALEIEAHEVPVHSDVFCHAIEAARDREAHAALRPQVVETGSFEELHLLSQNHQIFRPQIGRDVNLAGTFADLRLDAMMAVYHKVHLSHLV
jgi:hypothetical protein